MIGNICIKPECKIIAEEVVYPDIYFLTDNLHQAIVRHAPTRPASGEPRHVDSASRNGLLIPLRLPSSAAATCLSHASFSAASLSWAPQSELQKLLVECCAFLCVKGDRVCSTVRVQQHQKWQWWPVSGRRSRHVPASSPLREGRLRR